MVAERTETVCQGFRKHACISLGNKLKLVAPSFGANNIQKHINMAHMLKSLFNTKKKKKKKKKGNQMKKTIEKDFHYRKWPVGTLQ